ncbi:hypothetical protein C8Q76DRAFT_744978 [Earliella scabrosa]|nr:hypothetical protein C8Q76DRAFT_744978 [Earliella scabrosa]
MRLYLTGLSGYPACLWFVSLCGSCTSSTSGNSCSGMNSSSLGKSCVENGLKSYGNKDLSSLQKAVFVASAGLSPSPVDST